MADSVTQPAPSPKYPPGLYDAWRFAAFNGLSFQIVLGSTMILYAKTLHASATVVGVIAGMMPLLVIFQIPAANYINRVGYKRFVIGGWGTRTLFTFGMALVPLATGFLVPATQLVLILVLLFGFNLVRGISSCAWLPWIAHLVPEEIRGRYVARDAAMANLGSFITVLIASLCLGAAPHPWQFSVIFAFSALMGLTSLIFLKRVPDVEIPEHVRTSREPVPWLKMLRFPPFYKLMVMVVVWSVAYGGITTFTTTFMKVQLGMAEGNILLITTVSFIGGMSSLWLLGSSLDHLGSKPVLIFVFAAWLATVGVWAALAGRVLPTGPAILIGLQFFMGLLVALYSMAANRLAMAIIPPMGRNHFFALYSVLNNVTLGLAPVGWGLFIDLIGARQATLLHFEWNHYSCFFAATLVVFAATLLLARRLEEPKAASMEALLSELLIASPQRFWLRFWPRG